LEAAIISRREVVCAMLQSGGLNVCWLHKEQGKSEEPIQNERLPVAAAQIRELTVKVCNVCTYVSMYLCTTCLCIYLCLYKCMYVRAFVNSYVFTYLCLDVSIYVVCMHE